MIQVNDIFRLGKDAEFKQINDKGGFFSLWLVASDKQKQGDQWVDVPTWVSGSLWRSNDKMLPYLKKGSQVYISGKVYNREHEGKMYLTLDIRDLRLIGGKQDQQQQQQPATTPSTSANSTQVADSPSPGVSEDDIPF